MRHLVAGRLVAEGAVDKAGRAAEPDGLQVLVQQAAADPDERLAGPRFLGAGSLADDGDAATGRVLGGVLVIDERQFTQRGGHWLGFRSRLIRVGWSNHHASSRCSHDLWKRARSGASSVRIRVERVGSMPAMRSAKL